MPRKPEIPDAPAAKHRQAGRHAAKKIVALPELAHIKEKDHDKDFYKLCTYVEPQYHQYEFDLRVYLTRMVASGKPAWPAG